jgi:hypothetical protein
MTEFTLEQQHAFWQFVTGVPWLTPGGLLSWLSLGRYTYCSDSESRYSCNQFIWALHFVLLPVLFNCDEYLEWNWSNGDDDLPSVMTCANYLKLPSYSTKVWFFCLGASFFSTFCIIWLLLCPERCFRRLCTRNCFMPSTKARGNLIFNRFKTDI